MLLGRAEECATVDSVLDQAWAGISGVLLVAGEPGVGKSALLEYAAQSASVSGFQVVRAAGAEPEMELAFAGLQQLCAPLLDGVAQLPGPQRAAIETAFGVSAGVPPDPFFVGLGVLGLLAEAAAGPAVAWSIRRSGWIRRRRGRWGSRRGGCRRTRSRCCWRAASWVSWPAREGWPRCGWRGWPTPTRGRCWPRCFRSGRIRR